MLVSNLSLRKFDRAVDVLLGVAEQVGDLLADERADRHDEHEERQEHADQDERGGRAAPPAARRQSVDAGLDRQRQEQRHQQQQEQRRQSWSTIERVTTVAMKPSQKMATAFHTHRGMLLGRRPRLGVRTSPPSVVTDRRREGWRPGRRAASTSTSSSPSQPAIGVQLGRQIVGQRRRRARPARRTHPAPAARPACRSAFRSRRPTTLSPHRNGST